MKYEESGVSIDRATKIKKEISEPIASTWSDKVLSEVGHFGGLFRLGTYNDPVLVSSIDGVGTKLIVAKMANRYDTIGQDLVNHCINDILVQGAKPLFFLDYVAAGRLDPKTISDTIKGLATACREGGCALIGGETAEMPGIYQEGDFDLAGCIVGIVERDNIIDGSRIEAGDQVFALPSSGLHTNGYSLARKVVFDKLGLAVDSRVKELGSTVGEALLAVHVSYLNPIFELLDHVDIRGIAHITGGGVVDNFARVLPGGCDAVIRKGAWEVPPLFTFLEEKGGIAEKEMYHVFNMGLGMVFVCPPGDEKKITELESRLHATLVGEIRKGSGRVIIE